MGFFPPQECSIDDATSIWLLVGIAGLLVVIVASLAEAAVQWRRAQRTRILWWVWLPITPTLLWSLVCGVLAGKAIGWYGELRATLSPHPISGPVSYFGECSGILQTATETEFALGVGIMLLIVGASVLLLTRRRASAG